MTAVLYHKGPDAKQAVTYKGVPLIVYPDGRVCNLENVPYTPSKGTNGYWRIFAKNRGGKKVTLLLHTLIASVYYGYKPHRDYALFRDGDRENWSKANIQVKTRAQHRSEIKEANHA